MSLARLHARAKIRQYRGPEGHTAGLVLLGANLVGLILTGQMVVTEVEVPHGPGGTAVAVPDHAPAEEQTALAPSNATAEPPSS